MQAVTALVMHWMWGLGLGIVSWGFTRGVLPGNTAHADGWDAFIGRLP